MREAFTCHRAVAPIMWAFVGVACIKLLVTHLFLALWRPWVAAAVSLVSLSGVVWLVAGWRGPVGAVAHRLDEPERFAAALERWLAG